MFRPSPRILTSIIVAGAFFLTASPSNAQNYTWAAAGGGLWTDGTNWANLAANYPRNANDTAIFSSTGNSSARTVTLNAALSIRALEFNASQTGSVTIASITGGSLTLTNTVGHVTSITVDTASGDHTLAANLTLAGPLPNGWIIGANRTFTVTGSVSGTQGLSLSGGGTVLFNGTNTYTGLTAVTAGTLGGNGSLTSAVTVASGSTITAGTSASTPSLTLNNGLTVTGRNLVTLFSNNTASELLVPSGLVTVTGGSLELALGSGVTVSSFRAGGPRSFTIIDAANGQLTGTFAPPDFTTAGFAASEWSIGYNAAAGDVTLNFTPVPELVAMLGVAAAGLLGAWGLGWWGKSRVPLEA